MAALSAPTIASARNQGHRLLCFGILGVDAQRAGEQRELAPEAGQGRQAR